MSITSQYHKLLNEILSKGTFYDDPKRKKQRVKRLQIRNYELRHNMIKEFPAITTKKLAWKSVVTELLWFLKGDTNIKYLLEHNNPIWVKDAYNKYLSHIGKSSDGTYHLEPMGIKTFKERILDPAQYEKSRVESNEYKLGDVGPIYGHQWRNFNSQGIDQLSSLVHNMIHNPMSTDHIVMAWNPAQKQEMGLPPCHFGFIIEMTPLSAAQRAYIGNVKGYLSEEDMMKYCDKIGVPRYGFTLKWFQRSVDTFLGLPFNIASYGLLAHILGQVTGTAPLELVGVLSNVHLYSNSIEAVYELLKRDPNKHKPGHLDIKQNIANIDQQLEPEIFKLPEYSSYPGLKVEMLARDE